MAEKKVTQTEETKKKTAPRKTTKSTTAKKAKVENKDLVQEAVFENVEVTEEVKVEENKKVETTEVVENIEVKPEDVEIVTSSQVEDIVDKGAAEGEYNPIKSARNEEPTAFEKVDDSIIPENVSVGTVLEDKRVGTFNKYKKFRLYGALIVSGILVAIIAILLAVFFTQGEGKENLAWVLWTVASISVVLIIGMFFLRRMVDKKTQTLITKHVLDCEMTTIAFVYDKDSKVEDRRLSMTSKVKDEDVTNAHYFATINNIQSRFRFEGKYLNRAYSDCEISVSVSGDLVNSLTGIGNAEQQIIVENKEKVAEELKEKAEETKEVSEEVKQETQPQNKQQEKKVRKFTSICGLFGKYLSYDLCLNNNQGIIFVFRGKETFLPNYLKNYSEIKIENLSDDVVCYSTDEEFAKTLCKKEVIAVLNSFKHDNLFYGGFISMNSHGTSCALNFSDDVLEIPFAKVVNESVIQCYKDNVGKFLEFLKVVQE